MKAIILAAGRGTRLKPLTDTLPKCLIEIGKKTLLEHSLDNLKKNGINEAIIVIGYLGKLIKEKIGTSYNGMGIRYVENEEYSTTGHAYSLYKTKGFVNADTLLIEGDLLYESDAIRFILEQPEGNVILTTEISGSGDEVPIYVDKHNNLAYLKHPQRNEAINAKGEKLIGELVGILKFSKDFLSKVYEEAEKEYTKGNKDQYYEEAVFKASKSIPIKCALKKQLTWIEIDNIKDLNKARRFIFSKINKKLFKN